MLNRETFKEKAAPKTKDVEIPEWEDTVRIRQFSAAELQDLGKLAKADDKLGMAQAIAACVVDESGGLVFSEKDIPEIQSYSAAGLIRLNAAINVFNGLAEDTTKN